MNLISYKWLFVCVTVMWAALPCHAGLRLPAIFSDGMVLQQQQRVPVWGWADPGAEVTVEFAGQKKKGLTSASGKWQVELDPMHASATPGKLVVHSSIGNQQSEIDNVLVGEVWLCSGQSNMIMGMKTVTGLAEEKKAADYPALRIFRIGLKDSLEPQADCSGDWLVCSPDTLEQFAATAYFFGAEIHRELGVPVGLIRAAWGGTHIETWIPAGAHEKFPSVMAFKAQEDRKKEQGVADAQPWKYYPGKLYNGMVHPLVPYGLRGLLWYQGEGNAHTVHDAILYREQLGCLAKEWRAVWGYEFPVYAVQLPNFKAATTEPDAWAYVRESILNFSRDGPSAGVAITIDSGDPDDIHPKNKRPAGERLARQALVRTYGKALVPGGPIYRSVRFEGNKAVLSFDNIGSGLTVRGGGELKTFQVAGEDRRFIPAEAEIVNNTVVVSSPGVKNPVAVRYAWANNPSGCNLFNQEGFPASPFRTDSWMPEIPPVSCKRGIGGLTVSKVPSELVGSTYVYAARGNSSEPGIPFSFKTDRDAVMYVAVQDRGTPEIPDGWQKTDLTMVWGGKFTDRVYKVSCPAGGINIPAHNGKSGGFFGVPHMVFLKSGDDGAVVVTGLLPSGQAESGILSPKLSGK